MVGRPGMRSECTGEKSTYLLQIIISRAPWCAAPLSGHVAALFAPSGRAEVRSVCATLGLGGLGSRWCWFALESFHLLVKLGSELLILFGELADAIFRNPVVPAVR